MKKAGITLAILSAALLFGGASVWEGAVSVSLNGELPEGGLYAVTGSFPRNTVVDVVNLENGKTVRVIVAGGMDSPGLLAILSAEAADALGIAPQSTGRVRMTMPSDAEAFSRFTGGAGAREGTPREPLPPPPPASLAQAQPLPEEEPGDALPPGSAEYGEYAEEPPSEEEALAWDDPSDSLIVDIPGAPEEEEPPPDRGALAVVSPWEDPDAKVRDTSIKVSPQGIPLIEVPAAAPDSPPPETGYPPGDLAEAPAEYPENLAGEPTDTPPEYPSERPTESPASESAEPPALAEGSVPGAPEEIAEAETTEALSPPDAGAEFSLVPAELRPPEASSYTLPPEAEISPIPDASLAETPRETPPEPPLSIIEAGEPVVSAGPGEAEPAPGEAEPAPGEAEPAPGEAEDPGEPAAAPGYTPVFSVPRISRPEKGKYYLQLGAYTRAELVEEALSRIEQYYPLAVQAEDSEAPLYRILLGPVNSGEGGALLQRFKRGGYGDAFIKRDN